MMRSFLLLYSSDHEGDDERRPYKFGSSRSSEQRAFTLLSSVCWAWWRAVSGWPESTTPLWVRHQLRKTIERKCTIHRRGQGSAGDAGAPPPPRVTGKHFYRHFCCNEAKIGLNLVRCTPQTRPYPLGAIPRLPRRLRRGLDAFGVSAPGLPPGSLHFPSNGPGAG